MADDTRPFPTSIFRPGYTRVDGACADLLRGRREESRNQGSTERGQLQDGAPFHHVLKNESFYVEQPYNEAAEGTMTKRYTQKERAKTPQRPNVKTERSSPVKAHNTFSNLLSPDPVIHVHHSRLRRTLKRSRNCAVR